MPTNRAPDSIPFVLSCDPQEFLGLQDSLKEKLTGAFRIYKQSHPDATPWRVTSGRRTLRQQATEMAAMSPEQLRGLYCSGGIPSYVEELIQNMPLTPETAFQILAHRSEGYISKHLFGAAVDLAPSSIQDQELFRNIIAQLNLRLLDERQNGIPCFHIADNAIPASILRE